jgi:hypothetical protein
MGNEKRQKGINAILDANEMKQIAWRNEKSNLLSEIGVDALDYMIITTLMLEDRNMPEKALADSLNEPRTTIRSRVADLVTLGLFARGENDKGVELTWIGRFVFAGIFEGQNDILDRKTTHYTKALSIALLDLSEKSVKNRHFKVPRDRLHPDLRD